MAATASAASSEAVKRAAARTGCSVRRNICRTVHRRTVEACRRARLRTEVGRAGSVGSVDSAGGVDSADASGSDIDSRLAGWAKIVAPKARGHRMWIH
ncbi:hypothetical protein Kisp02_05840 [Kineosporia sp. NBRC 101731]|nr:hypothetical protein Kisp02_05840 [Kineosporia sp. NBRC 101731]